MSENKLTTEKPLVSIVCITFNQIEYIKDALISFSNQITTFPCEIIVHDDCSTDGTSEALDNFKKNYSLNIKLIKQNKNQYSQRGFEFINDIFKYASGKYIALCEGDDYWIDNHKLQKQIDFLESNQNYSISLHNAYRLDCRSNKKIPFNTIKLPAKMTVYDVIFRSWFSPTASFVFRNNLVNLPENSSMNGDMVILYQCALHGHIHYLDEIFSVYRYSSNGSLSQVYLYNKINLYDKKINFLNFVDKTSDYRYYHITSIMRLRYRLSRVFTFWKNFLTKSS